MTQVDLGTIHCYLDYCGSPGDYLVILTSAIVGQYLCDVGFIEGCPTGNCEDGYHIVGVIGKKMTAPTETHFATKEEAGKALFNLWSGRHEVQVAEKGQEKC